MWMRLTLDENKVIVAVETSMGEDSLPAPLWRSGPLPGPWWEIKIAAGFRKRVHTAGGCAWMHLIVNTFAAKPGDHRIPRRVPDQLRAVVEDPAANVKPKRQTASIFHDGESGAGPDNP